MANYSSVSLHCHPRNQHFGWSVAHCAHPTAPRWLTVINNALFSRRATRLLDVLSSENDLKDGVWSWRVTVGKRDAGRAHCVAVLDQPHHGVDARDLSLLDADDLHLLPAVLQHAQLLLVIEQVKHLPTPPERPSYTCFPRSASSRQTDRPSFKVEVTVGSIITSPTGCHAAE